MLSSSKKYLKCQKKHILTCLICLYFSVCCFASKNSWAKISLKSEIPAKHLLQENLKNLKKNDLASKELNLAKIHNAWLSEIVNLIKEFKCNQNNFRIPNDHVANYFTRVDAKRILKPILKNVYNLKITNKTINKIFPKKNIANTYSQSKTSLTYFRQHKIKDETYRAAKKLYKLTKNHTVITLGQTPLLLCEMLKAINDHESAKKDGVNFTKIINIPFSGRPDSISIDSHKKTWKKKFKDLTTKARIKNYRNFLNSIGFSPKKIRNKKIFILDDSSGPSLNAFLLFLTHWHKDEKIKLPDLCFINMKSKDNIYYIDKGKWKKADKKNPLALDNFTIDTYFLNMKTKTIYNMLEIKQNLRAITSLPAINWNLDIKKLMQNYPTEDAKKLLLKYYLYARNHWESDTYRCKLTQKPAYEDPTIKLQDD